MTDPQLVIAQLLQNNWSATIDPNIHTGKYREDEPDPQISVVLQDETPMNGGESGYASIDPTGKGGVQHLTGLINCSCWDNYDRTNDVKGNVYEMKEEVADIVVANQTNTELRIIAPGQYQQIPETDGTTVSLQGIMPVGYIKERRP